VVDREAFSIGEVSRKWGTSESTVRARIESGELAAFRVGRVWRVSAAALAEFIDQSNRAV
jgi:excisionase family DNA binding protein